MILRDGKLTTWEDTSENLLEAAREAAFGGGGEFRSEKHNLRIRVENGEGITESEELMRLALEAGLWVEPVADEGYFTILFNWPRDPSNAPNDRAIHITRTVISLAEAERRWGKSNLRQSAYQGKLAMWKSGRTWFTTEAAMKKLFGPEPGTEAEAPQSPRARSRGQVTGKKPPAP